MCFLPFHSKDHVIGAYVSRGCHNCQFGLDHCASVESAVLCRSPPRMGTGAPAFSFIPLCPCLPRAGDSQLQRGSKLTQKVDVGTAVPTNFCPKCFFPCQFPTDKILVEKSKSCSQLLHYKPFWISCTVLLHPSRIWLISLCSVLMQYMLPSWSTATWLSDWWCPVLQCCVKYGSKVRRRRGWMFFYNRVL